MRILEAVNRKTKGAATHALTKKLALASFFLFASISVSTAQTAPDASVNGIAPSSSSQQVDSQAPQQPVTTQGRVLPETDNSQPSAPTPPSTELPSSDQQASPVEVIDPQNRTDIPHDLSPWGMFMAADWVVKGVMIGLAVASVLTWTVLLAKTIELFGARARANRTLRVVREAKTLAEATKGTENRGGPGAMMVRMANHEMQLSDDVIAHTDGGGIKERVTSVLNRIEVHAGRRMARGTGILATIGSISPFVGLFGTVWGIMNSFISISESQTTNLAVVAPGIAEALLATAIGLVAAIPAVVFYNVFARAITGYRHLLADVASGVERLVSRDLDFRRVPPGSAKASVTLVGR